MRHRVAPDSATTTVLALAAALFWGTYLVPLQRYKTLPWSNLVPMGIGITAYGAAYLLVHDVVIHRRLPWPAIPDRLGSRLRAAHNVHHLYSEAPFGFLAPVVPRRHAERAHARSVDRTDRQVRRSLSGR